MLVYLRESVFFCFQYHCAHTSKHQDGFEPKWTKTRKNDC